jgi:hypothetical protein
MAVLLIGAGSAKAMYVCEAYNPSPGPFPKGRGDPFVQSLLLDKLSVKRNIFARTNSPSLWEGAGGWVLSTMPIAHLRNTHFQ